MALTVLKGNIVSAPALGELAITEHGYLAAEDGKIIGHGTHEELLKTCEAYSEIYTTQIGNQTIGAGEEAAV